MLKSTYSDSELQNDYKKDDHTRIFSHEIVHKHSNSEIIFLGTGSSGGIPTICHLTLNDTEIQNLNDRMKSAVQVSKKSMIGDPKFNKNYRCNPSIMIKYRNQKNIMIDCGTKKLRFNSI